MAKNEKSPETVAPAPAPTEQLTVIAALQNLTVASREARLTAGEHDLIRKSVETILNFIKEHKPELLTPGA